MFVNRNALLAAKPIVHMYRTKRQFRGTSFGLVEAGYDIRIRETVTFTAGVNHPRVTLYDPHTEITSVNKGRFILASSMEDTNRLPIKNLERYRTARDARFDEKLYVFNMMSVDVELPNVRKEYGYQYGVNVAAVLKKH